MFFARKSDPAGGTVVTLSIYAHKASAITHAYVIGYCVVEYFERTDVVFGLAHP